MVNSPNTTDLTRGIYRRLYGGFVRGRRINAISLSAEAWFWRIHSAADDFGNLDGEPTLIFAATVGRRNNVTIEDVTAWVREMLGAGLIREYEVNGEKYIHIVEFVERQPAGKNGRRVRRVPDSPYDSPEPENGETGGIQGNPDVPSASHSHTDNHNQRKHPTDASGEPVGTPTSPPPGSPLLVFPCCRGRRSKSTEWGLSEAFAAELREAYPGVDVIAESRRALTWIRATPSNRKTFDGMRVFLFRWMARVKDKGGSGAYAAAPAGNGRPRALSHGEARQAELEESVNRLNEEDL